MRVIDLSLSTVEIRELMLTEMAQSECMDLLIQQSLFKNDRKALQDKLVKEEVLKLAFSLIPSRLFMCKTETQYNAFIQHSDNIIMWSC